MEINICDEVYFKHKGFIRRGIVVEKYIGGYYNVYLRETLEEKGKLIEVKKENILSTIEDEEDNSIGELTVSLTIDNLDKIESQLDDITEKLERVNELRDENNIVFKFEGNIYGIDDFKETIKQQTDEINKMFGMPKDILQVD